MAGKSVVQIHHRGDRGVDGILRLIELAGHDGPLEAMLTSMCDQIAAITEVDVVSVYAVEGDRLVMRGNFGFPDGAIGTVQLAIGEGITGLVAECMRPVSASNAAAESAYKHVPGLGEERYPVFAGIPLVAGGASIGVLVLQRRRRAFATDEITLATALGAPVMLALERRRSTAIRSARLAGIGQVAGTVLGRAAVIPTATSFDVTRSSDPAIDRSVDRSSALRLGEAGPCARAFARLREDLGRAVKRLADCPQPAIGAALDRFALALCDARLREQLEAALESSTASGPSALRTVAREYARAAQRQVGTTPEHAAELEELCALLGDPRSLRPGAVWIADRIGAVAAIVAVGRGAAALVAGDALSGSAIAIARAARIPAVSDVAGLFGWIRPEDLLAVDGDRGAILVHPAPSEIERLRQTR